MGQAMKSLFSAFHERKSSWIGICRLSQSYGEMKRRSRFQDLLLTFILEMNQTGLVQCSIVHTAPCNAS